MSGILFSYHMMMGNPGRRDLNDQERVSRRTYLKYVGIAVLGISGSAIALWEIRKSRPSYPLEAVYSTQTSTSNVTEATSAATKATETATSFHSQKSLVSVVRGNSDTQIEMMLRRSIDNLGGMGKMVSPGQTVVVKPSVLTSDKACAPDPRLVAAVVKLAREAGGAVVVAESSGNGDTSYNLSKVGITSAAEDAGAEVRDLQKEKTVQVSIPDGVALEQVQTYPTIHACDVLISVPGLKRHSSTTVTISLKNMMGTLPPSEMRRFHTIGLSQCIADLNTVIRSDLTVVDATYAMTRTGPTGGDMVKLDTIIATEDPVAADAVAAKELQELEERIGLASQLRFDASEVRHIRAAADLGVGTGNLDNLQIIVEALA